MAQCAPDVGKSPFDTDDKFEEPSVVVAGGRAASLTLRASQGGLSGRLSALQQDLSQRLSHLSDGPMGREAAAKAFADDEDTVTESGKAAWWELAATLVCCMFGAGVLGLPYALASQGWVLGMVMLLLAIATSCYSAFLLAELHTLRDGRRVRTLRALGEAVWGKRGRTIVVWLQFKDFHALTIVSLIGSVCPLVYAGIAFVCILIKGKAPSAEYGMIHKGSAFATAMNVFSGIGAFAYAFGGQVVQNEVTAMVRTPPAVIVSARKALTLCYAILAVCYIGVATAGFGMLGTSVTSNVLQSIPYAAPAIIANVGVLLHVGAAYQAFSMTVYLMIEDQVQKRKWLPPAIAKRPWIFRLVVRTAYCCVITFFAALIPFFSSLSGLKGGACMVPLCFIFPIAMWQTYNRDVASRARAALNWGLVALFSCIALVATVGSVYKIVQSASSFQLFA